MEHVAEGTRLHARVSKSLAAALTAAAHQDA